MRPMPCEICYVVPIDDANILRVTVTSDPGRIQEWLNIAINSYHGHLLGIHAEPRPFKSKLVHRSLQPTIRTLFVAIGPRVLVVQVRRAKDLPRMFVDFLLDDQFYFVGMDMRRLCRWLYGSGFIMNNTSTVRELAANQTRREELRTAGLKKIFQAVLRLSVDHCLTHSWSKWWSTESLSPKLVTQGSIRAFMAFEAAQACRRGQHEQGQSSNVPIRREETLDKSCRQCVQREQHQHNNINYVRQLLIAFLPLVWVCLELRAGQFLMGQFMFVFLLWVFLVF